VITLRLTEEEYSLLAQALALTGESGRRAAIKLDGKIVREVEA